MLAVVLVVSFSSCPSPRPDDGSDYRPPTAPDAAVEPDAARLAPRRGSPDAAPAPPPKKRSTICPGADAPARIFVFPHHLRAKQPLRIIALAWEPASLGQIQVVSSAGAVAVQRVATVPGPPGALELHVPAPPAGNLEIRVLTADGSAVSACARRHILGAKAQAPVYRGPLVWRWTRAWSGWVEALFSAWIARLFHVNINARGSWYPLHQLTRNASRNWLHNALGLGEDGVGTWTAPAVMLWADCADLPYYLRAYFSWKMGLPFIFQRCSRGDEIRGPVCAEQRDNLSTRYARYRNPVSRFNQFVREWIGWSIHSGTARTPATDGKSDFYPVTLTLRALRPGRIFVDPRGHVFMVSQQVRQTPRRVGLLFGVDAHPDRTISRKRFSEGAFGFNHRVQTGGFKAFRPIAVSKGRCHYLTNDEIRGHPELGDFSLQQTRFKRNREFYAAVHRVLNPLPADPRALYRSKLAGLAEVLMERKIAVEVGIRYMTNTGWREVTMPRGRAIFQTVGPWEVVATPARDLRLLQTIRDVRAFPRFALRNKAHLKLSVGCGDGCLRRQLRAIYKQQAHKPLVTYVRSNGETTSLSIDDILQRRQRLQMAYNPNDCAEVRWGARPGSAEHKSCKRRAPPYQLVHMRRARRWFHSLRLPVGHTR